MFALGPVNCLKNRLFSPLAGEQRAPTRAGRRQDPASSVVVEAVGPEERRRRKLAGTSQVQELLVSEMVSVATSGLVGRGSIESGEES